MHRDIFPSLEDPALEWAKDQNASMKDGTDELVHDPIMWKGGKTYCNIRLLVACPRIDSGGPIQSTTER